MARSAEGTYENIFNIAAVIPDGLDVAKMTVLTLTVESNHETVQETLNAMKSAAGEFPKSPFASDLDEPTRRDFNVGDLVNHVPDVICENHGFRVTGNIVSDIAINHDDHLF